MIRQGKECRESKKINKKKKNGRGEILTGSSSVTATLEKKGGLPPTRQNCETHGLVEQLRPRETSPGGKLGGSSRELQHEITTKNRVGNDALIRQTYNSQSKEKKSEKRLPQPQR